MSASTIYCLSSLFAFLSLAHAVVLQPDNERRTPTAATNAATASASPVFNNAQLTFYDVGLGSCGRENVDSDFVVALNTDQYGSSFFSPDCFKTVTITYKGKSAQATIVDECPTCPFAGLDLSRGLFEFFASTNAGALSGSWFFND